MVGTGDKKKKSVVYGGTVRVDMGVEGTGADVTTERSGPGMDRELGTKVCKLRVSVKKRERKKKTLHIYKESMKF